MACGRAFSPGIRRVRGAYRYGAKNVIEKHWKSLSLIFTILAAGAWAGVEFDDHVDLAEATAITAQANTATLELLIGELEEEKLREEYEAELEALRAMVLMFETASDDEDITD